MNVRALLLAERFVVLPLNFKAPVRLKRRSVLGAAALGATDLDMQYSVNGRDMSDRVKKHRFAAMRGDPLKDAADLKKNSSLTHAAAIKQPLLLAFGSADQRAPLEWVVYGDEGRGWRAPEHPVDFWHRTARFLDQYLAPTWRL